MEGNKKSSDVKDRGKTKINFTKKLKDSAKKKSQPPLPK
jgi:hypothetical protein